MPCPGVPRRPSDSGWIVAGCLVLAALPALAARAAGEAAPLPAPAPDRSGLLALLRTGDLGPGAVLLALGAAVFLGGVHALSPGHGKTVVAAYLVGSRGRVRDAIFLGIVVTATHTASVLLLGVLALYFAERSPERLGPWLGFLSGILIVAIGFVMFLKRLETDAHGHAHAHGHIHAHAHPRGHVSEPRHANPRAHPPRDAPNPGTGILASDPAAIRPTLGALLALGVSGGMAPCPDAIAVILAAVAYGKVAAGLVLVLAFSLGLAAVLISVGIAMVLAGGVVGRIRGGDGRGEDGWMGPWARRLPIASAVVVMILGAVIALASLAQGGILAWGG